MMEWIRRVINKLFAKKDIKDALKVDVAVSEEMLGAIGLWSEMYANNSPWVDNNLVKSMNLPATIANEISRLVTLELRTEVTANEELDEVYQKVIKDIKEVTEYAAAKGGLVFKPYYDGEGLAVDYVQADMFYPTNYDSSGNITGGVFIDKKKEGTVIFTRLEHHELLADGYLVTHSAFKNSVGDDKSLGIRTDLTEVSEWADIEPEVFIPGVDRPLFSYFKIPMANNIDSHSPLGVSVFARSVDLIAEADRQYSRILWEYEGSELAIDASSDLFKMDGSIPKGKERLYRRLDTEKEDFFNAWAPEIRDESFQNGLNDLLRRVEFSSGLAYGTLSDAQSEAKTATEIKTSKQRTYSTVLDIQKSLEQALTELVEIFIIWGEWYELDFGEMPDITFEWDDSLALDMDTEFALMLREVSAGILRPEIYLQRRYGLSEEKLKEYLPEDYYEEDVEEGF